MILFDSMVDIPKGFTGHCKVGKNQTPAFRWYKNGRLHRLDGPAVMYGASKSGPYYINGVLHSTREYWIEPEVVVFGIKTKLKAIVELCVDNG